MRSGQRGGSARTGPPDVLFSMLVGLHLLGTTSDSLTAFRTTPAARMRELLGIVNYMVARFGSRENVLLNYGVQGGDFTFDAAGTV